MDNEFKKLLAGAAWANEGDRLDPDSSEISPVLSRSTGWPASFSLVNGNVPDRRRVNQLFRELAGAAKEVAYGVSIYDPEVNYKIHAITNSNGDLYKALKDNGPLTNNAEAPTDANQTTWERVSGALAVPNAPQDFDFDNSTPGQVTVRWEPGRDNGARIQGYYFQSRTANTAPWLPADPGMQLTYAERVIPNLQTGTRLFVRAAAFNSVGTGPYAEDADGEVVVGTVPGGGNLLALLATPLDSSVSTAWKVPPNGGHPITLYTLQWRDASEQFSGSQQSTVSGQTALRVDGLTNDTLYYFRVAATNQIGQGAWSNIATATPRAAAVITYPPTVNAPNVSRNGRGFTATTRITPSSVGVTAPVESTEWQYRPDPGTIWTTFSGGITSATQSGLTPGDYLVRYRVSYTINGVAGTSQWSAAGSIEITGPVPDAPSAVFGSAVWISVSRGLNSPGYVQYNITPGADNGYPIDRYWVRLSVPNRAGGSDPNSQGAGTAGVDSSVLANSGRIQSTSMARGGTGRIYGRCRNANGWGPWKAGNIVTVGGPNYYP